jgi:hypothetical protein
MNASADLHITSNTPLAPAIKTWRVYLNDQGRSLYTVKAFTGDLNLLAGFFSPETTVGSVTTDDLNRFLEWLQTRGSVQSKKPVPPHHLGKVLFSMAPAFRPH